MVERHFDYDAERSALRFRLAGERGWIELVVGAEFAWVAFPVPGEDVPDCEITLGLGIAALWRAADQDDEVIWAQLEQLYAEQAAEVAEIDLSEHPAGPELLAELSQAAAWAGIAEEFGSEDDYQQAHVAHTDVLRRIVAAVRDHEI